jgi:hypothetical protein
LFAKEEPLESYTPESKPYDLSYGQWTVKWSQWILSIPMEVNPADDQTGKNAGVNQTDPNVWFLAGTFGGKAIYCNAWNEGYTSTWNQLYQPQPQQPTQNVGPRANGQQSNPNIILQCKNVVNCNPNTAQRTDQNGEVTNR